MSDEVVINGQTIRKMGPLKDDHPMVIEERPCAACNVPLQSGDAVTIIALGPGDDDEERKRMREGRPYNAVADVVHWACATGETDDDND